MIRCRGMKFRDEDDAYEYFKQRELDEADDPSIPQVLLQADAAELAAPSQTVHGEAASHNGDEAG